jgi:hypothetical protein
MPVGTWFAYFMRGAYATRKRGGAMTGVFLFAPPSDVARLGACFAAGTYSAVKVKAFLERFLASAFSDGGGFRRGYKRPHRFRRGRPGE